MSKYEKHKNIRLYRLSRMERIMLQLPADARLLDIGCGSAESLIPLKSLRPDVRMIGADKIDYADNPPEVLEQYVRLDLDAERLPLEPGSFDCVRMAHVIEHLGNPQLVMEQVGKLLKPGGIFYASVPNERSLIVPSFNLWHSQHVPFNFFDDPTHIRPVTAHGLYCWFEAAGFRDEEIKIGLERTPYQLLHSLPAIFKALVFRKRARMATAVWTLVGWVSYGVGRKG